MYIITYIIHNNDDDDDDDNDNDNVFPLTTHNITLLQGDSGGPLTFKRNNHHVLVGVLAVGKEEERSSWTQVSLFRNWIDKHMKNPKFCKNDSKA